jgi:exonuclease III
MRIKKLLEQGWTDAIRKLYPKEKIYTFGIIFEMLTSEMPV